MSYFIRIFDLINVLSSEKILGSNFIHVPKIPYQSYAKLWKTGSLCPQDLLEAPPTPSLSTRAVSPLPGHGGFRVGSVQHIKGNVPTASLTAESLNVCLW